MFKYSQNRFVTNRKMIKKFQGSIFVRFRNIWSTTLDNRETSLEEGFTNTGLSLSLGNNKTSNKHS